MLGLPGAGWAEGNGAGLESAAVRPMTPGKVLAGVVGQFWPRAEEARRREQRSWRRDGCAFMLTMLYHNLAERIRHCRQSGVM